MIDILLVGILYGSLTALIVGICVANNKKKTNKKSEKVVSKVCKINESEQDYEEVVNYFQKKGVTFQYDSGKPIQIKKEEQELGRQ